MTVTAVTPPVAPNGDIERAMFAYLSPDPLGTDANMQALLNFCSTVGVTRLFMDMYNYLGGGNWTTTHQTRFELLCQMAHESGIRVYAYAGNTTWGESSLTSWVVANIIRPLQKYQSLCTLPSQLLDGLVFDVEYWTDDTQTASVVCPGLCDLMWRTREMLQMPGTKFEVGCTAAYWLADTTNTRASFSYQGKTAQDGIFLMDNADFVVVLDYFNNATANSNGAGIEADHTAWNNYATSLFESAPVKGPAKLFVGVETQNETPSYISFYGMTKAQMETQLTAVSSYFTAVGARAYLGACVDDYTAWSAMS